VCDIVVEFRKGTNAVVNVQIREAISHVFHKEDIVIDVQESKEWCIWTDDQVQSPLPELENLWHELWIGPSHANLIDQIVDLFENLLEKYNVQVVDVVRFNFLFENENVRCF